MLRIGVIGYGYWGPNVVRNFAMQPDCRVTAICDRDPAARARHLSSIQRRRRSPMPPRWSPRRRSTRWPSSPRCRRTTPLPGRRSRMASTSSSRSPSRRNRGEAEDLIELAERKNLVIMVDHTFLFTGAVRKMKELIDQGVLGRLYYYDSTRVNLGLFQHDVNVVWDLARTICPSWTT